MRNLFIYVGWNPCCILMEKIECLIVRIETGKNKFFQRINPLIDRLHREQSRIGYRRATLPLIKFSSVVVLSQFTPPQRSSPQALFSSPACSSIFSVTPQPVF